MRELALIPRACRLRTDQLWPPEHAEGSRPSAHRKRKLSGADRTHDQAFSVRACGSPFQDAICLQREGRQGSLKEKKRVDRILSGAAPAAWRACAAA
jgi:hypothetical protein